MKFQTAFIAGLFSTFSIFMMCCSLQEDSIPYPLNYCLVGGSDLGEMGEPVSYIHEGQEFKFCCKPCIPKFKKNPQKYIQELKEETITE